MHRRTMLTFVGSLAAAVVAASAAVAQSKFPDRPIKLMVAFSAAA